MGAQWKAKHKEAAANAKGRVFGKLSKEIMIAARNGADPSMNPRLRLAVEQAKKASMPRETLERAIKKGAGLTGETVNFERLTYEGFAPHRVAVIVECLTDNINRTVSEIRVLFRKGQLGVSGSVAWDFDHVGMIEASPTAPDSDAELAAIEAGAQEFETEENGDVQFITDATDLDAVVHALPDFGFSVHGAKLGYKPKNPVDSLSDAEREEVEAFLEALDAHDDVQNVYVALGGERGSLLFHRREQILQRSQLLLQSPHRHPPARLALQHPPRQSQTQILRFPGRHLHQKRVRALPLRTSHKQQIPRRQSYHRRTRQLLLQRIPQPVHQQ